jgi:predicted phosphodiesterase
MKTKADIARKYRLKYGKEMPTMKLARIMYKENNLVFKNIEDARNRLRYIEGKTGEGNRKELMGKAGEFVMDNDRPKNPYKLPESDETSYEPYILKAKRILSLSDIHIPYHSNEALTVAFGYGKKTKPDTILLNGDTIDFFRISRFVKDPTKRKFKDELAMFSQFFDILDKLFPNAKKVFKIGNHEERYNQFLWEKAAELEGVEEFKLENIIKARAKGIEVVGDKRIIKAGGLNIIHGHEFASGFFSPVNVARGLYLRGKTSAIQGHNHASSEHTEPDMNGNITTTWSTGCLCELHPAYMPINKWNHGFADIIVDGKAFEVINKRIYKGKIL